VYPSREACEAARDGKKVTSKKSQAKTTAQPSKSKEKDKKTVKEQGKQKEKAAPRPLVEEDTDTAAAGGPEEPSKLAAQLIELFNMRELLNDLGSEQKALLDQARAELGGPESTAAPEERVTPADVTTLELTVAALAKEHERVSSLFFSTYSELEPYLKKLGEDKANAFLEKSKSSEARLFIPALSQDGAIRIWFEQQAGGEDQRRFALHSSANRDSLAEFGQLDMDGLRLMQEALFKIRSLADVARANQISQEYTKRLACFPEAQCPAERQKGAEGTASIEVRFAIRSSDEIGALILQNRGSRQQGVFVNEPDTLVMQAYLHHMVQKASAQGAAGPNLDALFDQVN
jgi:hypothetical protein